MDVLGPLGPGEQAKAAREAAVLTMHASDLQTD